MDHRNPARAGGGRLGSGSVQEARTQLADILRVEGQARRAGRIGGPACEGAWRRGREPCPAPGGRLAHVGPKS